MLILIAPSAQRLAVMAARIFCLALMVAGILAFAGPQLHAQTTAAGQDQKDRLTVDADEIVYDTDNKSISARGNAKLYYKGKILEADQVIYRSDSERVFAEGHVVLTEPTGEVLHANSLELTDQFHDGFIQSLRIDTVDSTHFVAPRAERVSDRQTIFERGTYTACDACKDDPTKPPLWQVRARRIIHNKLEKVIYYEGATLDLAGTPLVYIPYFSAPDTSMPRKSGFLTPVYSASTSLGQGLAIPYYYVISPDRDITLTPTLYSRQGVMIGGEWRQRLETGTYSINGAIISQSDQGAFLSSPNGAGDQHVRGYIETIGAFPINARWKWGWDLAYVSDKWFYQNYQIETPSVTQFGSAKRESTSTAYLRGEDQNSFFDARSYYFQTLLTEDDQNHQPLILPVVDYDRRFHPGGTFGGEVGLTANLTNLSRLEADFGTLSGTCSAPYTTTNCFMRGIGGDYSRYTTELSWRRSFIDPLGQSWTPFASMRGDAAFTTLFDNGTANSAQSSFAEAAHEGQRSVRKDRAAQIDGSTLGRGINTWARDQHLGAGSTVGHASEQVCFTVPSRIECQTVMVSFPKDQWW